MLIHHHHLVLGNLILIKHMTRCCHVMALLLHHLRVYVLVLGMHHVHLARVHIAVAYQLCLDCFARLVGAWLLEGKRRLHQVHLGTELCSLF